MWSVSAQISIVHLMLPVPTTLLPEMTQADLEQLTAWPCTGEEKPLCCCAFPLSSNTICIQILVGRIFCRSPVSQDFCDYTFARHTLSKDLRPMRVTIVAITQQREKYYKHLSSDLSRYCHFKETLLTPSRVVDTSMIYLRR